MSDLDADVMAIMKAILVSMSVTAKTGYTHDDYDAAHRALGRLAEMSGAGLFNRIELGRLMEWFSEWDFADGCGSGADELDEAIRAKIQTLLDSSATANAERSPQETGSGGVVCQP